MTKTDYQKSKAEGMLAMLFLGEGLTINRCCGCISLRIGVIIIAMIVLLNKIQFYMTSFYYFTIFARVPIIIFDVFSSIAYIISVIGVFKLNFKYAYWAHVLTAISSYMYTIGGFIIVLLIGVDYELIVSDKEIEDKNGFGFVYFVFIFLYVLNVLGYFLNHIMNFCFAKELGLGHIDVIYAREIINQFSDDSSSTKDLGTSMV